MTLKELSEDIYGNNQPGNTEKTVFNVLAFYALLLIFVGLIYFMFYVGWTLQKNGWDAAQNYYELNFQIKPSFKRNPTLFLEEFLRNSALEMKWIWIFYLINYLRKVLKS